VSPQLGCRVKLQPLNDPDGYVACQSAREVKLTNWTVKINLCTKKWGSNNIFDGDHPLGKVGSADPWLLAFAVSIKCTSRPILGLFNHKLRNTTNIEKLWKRQSYSPGSVYTLLSRDTLHASTIINRHAYAYHEWIAEMFERNSTPIVVKSAIFRLIIPEQVLWKSAKNSL